MSLTDRDRKIILILVPLALVLGYWFVLLAPKRAEESKVHTQLQSVQTQRDTARQSAAQLGGAKRNYASDYATVIYLGKSIPSTLDMPSLLVQLDSAASGTGIKFVDVKAGDGSSPAPSSAPPAPSGGSSAPNGGTGPNAPGAPPAQSGPGQAAQNAGGAVNNSNTAQSNAGLPAGGSAGGGSCAGGSASQALACVPLDFEFKGSFFDLANFFHRMKRFVEVANNQIVVRGRLIVINSFSFDSSQSFPAIDAQVHATVYLAPPSQGTSAGAGPQGPAGATPASTPSPAPSTPAPAPTATVTAP